MKTVHKPGSRLASGIPLKFAVSVLFSRTDLISMYSQANYDYLNNAGELNNF